MRDHLGHVLGGVLLVILTNVGRVWVGECDQVGVRLCGVLHTGPWHGLYGIGPSVWGAQGAQDRVAARVLVI